MERHPLRAITQIQGTDNRSEKRLRWNSAVRLKRRTLEREWHGPTSPRKWYSRFLRTQQDFLQKSTYTLRRAFLQDDLRRLSVYVLDLWQRFNKDFLLRLKRPQTDLYRVNFFFHDLWRGDVQDFLFYLRHRRIDSTSRHAILHALRGRCCVGGTGTFAACPSTVSRTRMSTNCSALRSVLRS